MEKYQIEGLEDDTQILSVRYLYRTKNPGKWKIRLKVHPYQENDSLTFSYAPLLARKKYLNPTQNYAPKGYSLPIQISDTSDWQSMKIGDCEVLKNIPLLKVEKSQYCFYFTDFTGRKIVLPQFELARYLFFRDTYLARLSLELDSLKTEFSVDTSEDGGITINIQPVSNYPKASVQNREKMRTLAWILLDDEIRRSYESIGMHQFKFGEDTPNYRRFDFSFSPPPLRGVYMMTRGRYIKEINCLYVYEIVSVDRLINKTPPYVEFFHPRMDENVRGSGPRGRFSSYSGADDQSLTDDESNADMNHRLLDAGIAPLGFVNKLETKLVYKKQKVGSAGRPDNTISDNPSNVGSLEESTISGTIKPIDWMDTPEEEEGNSTFHNRFNNFFQMIKVLQSDYNYKILSLGKRKLPSIKRCKKHVMANGEDSRCYVVVQLEVNGRCFHVVEVDTSDGVPLSTLLLMLDNHDKWLKNAASFERELLRKSINWPSKFLNSLCGSKGYKRIRHPRVVGNNNDGSFADSIKNWAERFNSWASVC